MILVFKKNSTKQNLEKLSKEIKPKKLFKASEFCGKVKVKGDAVKIQRRLRNEWK